jgi:hypothetical protein
MLSLFGSFEHSDFGIVSNFVLRISHFDYSKLAGGKITPAFIHSQMIILLEYRGHYVSQPSYK